MTLKKLLVAYDESKPSAGQGDFLAVVVEGGDPVFYGLRSRRTYNTGRIVFLGREITEKDVFAKLIDSGRKIESVDRALKDLRAYLHLLDRFKIGNVVSIVPKSGDPGFDLIKIAEMPKSEAKKLP